MRRWPWGVGKVTEVLSWDGSGVEFLAAYASGRCTSVRC